MSYATAKGLALPELNVFVEAGVDDDELAGHGRLQQTFCEFR
jgi:hypothetical protein